ncbi:MAG: zinc-ribbon domain-containing protein [Chloroflexota bacterium]
MIIFGSRNRTVKKAAGEFFCPKCRAVRLYQLKKVAQYFTLYFIPIFPIKQLGEYVECEFCKTTYRPEVLNLNRPPAP